MVSVTRTYNRIGRYLNHAPNTYLKLIFRKILNVMCSILRRTVTVLRSLPREVRRAQYDLIKKLLRQGFIKIEVLFFNSNIEFV